MVYSAVPQVRLRRSILDNDNRLITITGQRILSLCRSERGEIWVITPRHFRAQLLPTVHKICTAQSVGPAPSGWRRRTRADAVFHRRDRRHGRLAGVTRVDNPNRVRLSTDVALINNKIEIIDFNRVNV